MRAAFILAQKASFKDISLVSYAAQVKKSTRPSHPIHKARLHSHDHTPWRLESNERRRGHGVQRRDRVPPPLQDHLLLELLLKQLLLVPQLLLLHGDCGVDEAAIQAQQPATKKQARGHWQ
jgi:hypothetical protein